KDFRSDPPLLTCRPCGPSSGDSRNSCTFGARLSGPLPPGLQRLQLTGSFFDAPWSFRLSGRSQWLSRRHRPTCCPGGCSPRRRAALPLHQQLQHPDPPGLGESAKPRSLATRSDGVAGPRLYWATASLMRRCRPKRQSGRQRPAGAPPVRLQPADCRRPPQHRQRLSLEQLPEELLTQILSELDQTSLGRCRADGAAQRLAGRQRAGDLGLRLTAEHRLHCCWPHPRASPASGCGTWINHPASWPAAPALLELRLVDCRNGLSDESLRCLLTGCPRLSLLQMDSASSACDAVGWSCSQQLLAEQVCRLASLFADSAVPDAGADRPAASVPELVAAATDLQLLGGARPASLPPHRQPLCGRRLGRQPGSSCWTAMPAPSCERLPAGLTDLGLSFEHADWSCRAGVGPPAVLPPNLRRAAAGGLPPRADQLRLMELLASCPGLAFLTLDLCTDDLLPALLSRLPRLHCLRLTDCSRLTHQAWANLRELQEPRSCHSRPARAACSQAQLTDEALADLCASPVARGLRRLSLSFDCSQLTAASLASIASGCPLLTAWSWAGAASGRPTCRLFGCLLSSTGVTSRRSSKLCLISCFELAETGEQLHHCSRTMAEACASQERPAPKSLRLEAAEAAELRELLRRLPRLSELTMNQKFSDSLAAVLADGCGGRLHSRAGSWCMKLSGPARPPLLWRLRLTSCSALDAAGCRLVVSRLSQGLQELELKDALCDGLDRALPLSLCACCSWAGHPCSKTTGLLTGLSACSAAADRPGFRRLQRRAAAGSALPAAPPSPPPALRLCGRLTAPGPGPNLRDLSRPRSCHADPHAVLGHLLQEAVADLWRQSRSARGLRRLSLSKCDRLTAASVASIARGCPWLLNLDLCGFDCIARDERLEAAFGQRVNLSGLWRSETAALAEDGCEIIRLAVEIRMLTESVRRAGRIHRNDADRIIAGSPLNPDADRIIAGYPPPLNPDADRIISGSPFESGILNRIIAARR
uniref:F-box domain-containing protein n=1 Tax=Macrostomum lignano TaxID=282301 RepID=A0A1I8F470_9PLAT